MPDPIVPNDHLITLYHAGVRQIDIAKHYGLATTETLRLQERRLGLAPRRKGVRPPSPTVKDVLGVDPVRRYKTVKPPSAQQVRFELVKAMVPDRWYRAVDLAQETGIPLTRVRANTRKLFVMGVLRYEIAGRNKDGGKYQLNLKRPE